MSDSSPKAASSRSILVPSLNAPERLDLFLVRMFPHTSRKFWKERLDSEVTVNGRKARKGQLLQGGENLLLSQIPPSLELPPRANLEVPIRVLYEDPYLIALDKAASIACHPLREDESDTLANGLIARYPELANFAERPREAGLLHRLDHETSGVLLVARSEEAWRAFRDLQRRLKITKFYLALVSGNLSGHGVFRQAIGHRGRNAKEMQVENDKARGLRTAETWYRSVRNQKEQSLLALKIHRGARHQIRVHLAHAGHPILGDKIYHPVTNSDFPRHLLHAHGVFFLHPFSKRFLWIKSPIPNDFAYFLSSKKTPS